MGFRKSWCEKREGQTELRASGGEEPRENRKTRGQTEGFCAAVGGLGLNCGRQF